MRVRKTLLQKEIEKVQNDTGYHLQSILLYQFGLLAAFSIGLAYWLYISLPAIYGADSLEKWEKLYQVGLPILATLAIAYLWFSRNDLKEQVDLATFGGRRVKDQVSLLPEILKDYYDLSVTRLHNGIKNFVASGLVASLLLGSGFFGQGELVMFFFAASLIFSFLALVVGGAEVLRIALLVMTQVNAFDFYQYTLSPRMSRRSAEFFNKVALPSHAGLLKENDSYLFQLTHGGSLSSPGDYLKEIIKYTLTLGDSDLPKDEIEYRAHLLKLLYDNSSKRRHDSYVFGTLLVEKHLAYLHGLVPNEHGFQTRRSRVKSNGPGELKYVTISVAAEDLASRVFKEAAHNGNLETLIKKVVDAFPDLEKDADSSATAEKSGLLSSYCIMIYESLYGDAENDSDVVSWSLRGEIPKEFTLGIDRPESHLERVVENTFISFLMYLFQKVANKEESKIYSVDYFLSVFIPGASMIQFVPAFLFMAGFPLSSFKEGRLPGGFADGASSEAVGYTNEEDLWRRLDEEFKTRTENANRLVKRIFSKEKFKEKQQEFHKNFKKGDSYFEALSDFFGVDKPAPKSGRAVKNL